MKSIFTEIYPPKSKSFIIGILYRPPDKIDFVYCIDQVFSQFSTLETQESYLLEDSNTPCLSIPAESTPESSPVKIWSVKSLPSEKRLNFLPPQQFYIT